ncbi:cytochrome b/b6 domain-containing protein [Azoarcus sp. KH32C]|uniref:cytochrome b/b6 domain-containing protein n=1 Tax=Azoarcus sp. KH32C TaxID=748247 RepID=UPI0002386501|nr:cytochrome b/b6 domain-containing protein [Azoarcus sp. KH32C]BAL24677.1 cytochrome b561 family protein [Azoarcus sp. KH32C]
MARVYVFKRFERFWHWAQALLIITMLLSGFEVHGTYQLLGWDKAVDLHSTAAWALMGLWVLAIFWHFTTGEWRQYIPTAHKMLDVALFYAFGMFRGEHHPYLKTRDRKHNPLQRVAYLGVKLFINPLIWCSGLFYLFYNQLAAAGFSGLALGTVALVHTFAAFLMLLFLIAHVYLGTAGHTPTAHFKAMLTGWDDDVYEESQAAQAK